MASSNQVLKHTDMATRAPVKSNQEYNDVYSIVHLESR